MADFGPDGNRQFAQFKDVLTTAVRNGRQLDGQINASPTFWIETTHGGAGWFAVMLWDGDGFTEPWDTGAGRYATEAEAATEARGWAAEESIEFRGDHAQ